jgi:hypothetical protein
MKTAGKVFLIILSVYLIGRAIVEPFFLASTPASTYRNDWGGPTLVGVAAVHMVPGILGAAYLIYLWRHRQPKGK